MPAIESDLQPTYRHSILDRLLAVPDGRNRPGPSRRMKNQREERIRNQVEAEAHRAHRQPVMLDWITAAVCEDLRCLLSASRPVAFEAVPPNDPIHRSLLTYGLTDLSDRSPDPATRDLLPALIRDAIARFEPRLSDVDVRIDSAQPFDPVIRLRIHAKLHVDPGPDLPINLDTVIWLGSRKVAVNGGFDGGEAAPALPA
jgi:type VI secretion system lysozyme-like protein